MGGTLGELNGLLPNSGGLADKVLDQERWLMAEDRVAELIQNIGPNKQSVELRSAMSECVQRLIRKCFPCQVFQYGTILLNTYLPDEDIDLTVCSNDPFMKGLWGSKLHIMLKNEEKRENAEFRGKGTKEINAKVDNMIGHDHLFKRSIILIKAWCYYESQILGAQHRIISTFALKT